MAKLWLSSLGVDEGTEAAKSKIEEDIRALAALISAGTLSISDAAVLAKLELMRALLATMDVDTSALAALIKAGNAAAVGDNAAVVADANVLAKLELIRVLLGTMDADTSALAANIKAGNTAAVGDNASVVADANVLAKLELIRALAATIDADTGNIAGSTGTTATNTGTTAAQATIIASAINQVDSTVKTEQLSRIADYLTQTEALDTTLVTTDAVSSSGVDISGARKVGILLDSTKIGSPTSVTYSFTIASATGGTHHPQHVIDENGSAVLTVAHTATKKQTVYLPVGMPGAELIVSAVGVGTLDAGNSFAIVATVSVQS